MKSTYRCLIVENSQVELARTLTATIAGSSGDGMWTTPLSATGELPATHWISAGLISEQFATMLPLTSYPADEEPIYQPGRPEVAAYLATEAGVPTTYEQVVKLFSAADVTEQDPGTAMDRLGLVMTQTPENVDGE